MSAIIFFFGGGEAKGESSNLIILFARKPCQTGMWKYLHTVRFNKCIAWVIPPRRDGPPGVACEEFQRKDKKEKATKKCVVFHLEVDVQWSEAQSFDAWLLSLCFKPVNQWFLPKTECVCESLVLQMNRCPADRLLQLSFNHIIWNRNRSETQNHPSFFFFF